LKDEWSLGSGAVTHPLLFECDKEGRVVWMSRRAREVVGDRPLRAAMSEYLRNGASFRVWTAFTLPATLLFAAQIETHRNEPGDLELQEDLLGLYFRLETAERKLAEVAARRKRVGRRAPALYQIERERQRLGRELHTGVGQMLAAIRLQLEFIATQMPNPSEAVGRALEKAGKLAEDALEQVRGVSRRLYPPEWQRLSIEEALTQMWETTGIPQRFASELRLEPPPREPAQEVKVVLYRAAQEALSNILCHSGAGSVEMTLRTCEDRIVLSVSDDGGGFDAGAQHAKSGMGLRSMRDAAEEIGAKFDVESQPGRTTLTVIAPFDVE
jgi:signal transduction histidine kinase